MEIRPLREADSRLELSRIYEESWKFAYRGIVPQAYLDGIPAGRWAKTLDGSGWESLVLAEGERLGQLFPQGKRPSLVDLRNPTGALTRLGTGEWKSRFRLLPYRSVGVDHGLLLAVRVDRMELDGQRIGPMLVALSPTSVSDGGGYQALIGA